MPSSTSSITALTADYDAIERAIRETSRGRWFLACYLERNRSAETRMLLEAIAKLESAMRDNGHEVAEESPLDSLAAMKEAVWQARSDIARMPGYKKDAVELPVRRFHFESIPAALASETQAIRDSAANIQSAAYALQAAGVFHGVARQIAERAEEIEQACIAQDAAANRAARMAGLLSEIEAELMSMFEDEHEVCCEEEITGDVHQFQDWRKERSIPDLVMEELSAVLSDQQTGSDSFER
jgi:hypothetical protein